MIRRPSHRLAAAVSFAALLLGVSATAAAADSLDQDIDSDQREESGQVVLDRGHVDLGMIYRDDEWGIRLHDDTIAPSVWRQLDDVVLAVTDDAVLTVPESGFEFLGLEPGSDAYVVPQTEAPGVVWVGWNTQDPGLMQHVDLGVTLRVTSVTGPGDLTLYLQSSSFGEPDVLFTTLEPFPQDAWIEVNTHTHSNWVFGAPGAYAVGVEFVAQTIAGQEIREAGTLRFAVGSQTDAAEAFALTAPVSDSPAPSDGPRADGTDAVANADGSGLTWIWIVSVAIVVALLIAVLVAASASRRARRAATEPATTPEAIR